MHFVDVYQPPLFDQSKMVNGKIRRRITNNGGNLCVVKDCRGHG